MDAGFRCAHSSREYASVMLTENVVVTAACETGVAGSKALLAYGAGGMCQATM